MTFRAGQKVECIDSTPDFRGRPTPLVFGAIYEVECVVGPDKTGIMGLVIIGCYSPHPFNAWRSTRFRPFVERKTDISIFTAMLTPAQKKERA